MTATHLELEKSPYGCLFANYRQIFELRDLKVGICQFKNILPLLAHSGSALVLANQLSRALDHIDLHHL